MPDKTLDLLLKTVGPGGSIERNIQFSVLLNWQTMENISERNHQRCREVAEAFLGENGYMLWRFVNRLLKPWKWLMRRESFIGT